MVLTYPTPLPVGADGNVDYSSVDWSTHIVLQANDSTAMEYAISKSAARMSTLLRDLLEDQDPAEPDAKILVPNVDGETMKYVIAFMEHHWSVPMQAIEKPLKAPIVDVISEWDKEFLMTDLIAKGVERDHEVLIQVIMAANSLNVRDLLDLTCAAVASMIRGKQPEEVRALFQIHSDFTPEDEARIREENRWCEQA